MYGIEICKAISEESEGTFDLKKPTLYSALKRLEQDKLVTVRTQDSPIGGIRNYYSLTDAGREVLANKKYDWIYSKVLIDNLVLNSKPVGHTANSEPVSAPVTAAASAVSKFTSALPYNLSPYEAAASARMSANSNVSVAVRDITPVEQYAAVNREYITVPLGAEYHEPVKTPIIPARQPARQIAVDMTKVEKIEIYDKDEPSLLKPFVRHSHEKRNGKFVLYNRLRMFCSVIVTVLLGAGLECAYLFAKKTYTVQEANFFKVGWVCIGVYLLANIALFFAAPRHKQVVTRSTKGLVSRAILTACIAIGAVSINVIAGLSAINSADYMVYWLVPCIVGTVFVLEGLAILSLRRVRFFLA